MFKRRTCYTLNRVRDSVTFREGKEELHLYVDSDANSIVHRIQNAQKLLVSINAESSVEDRKQAAMALADAFFGHEQALKIFEFYHNDETCVATICGMYFADKKAGLSKLIAKAQKKAAR